MFNKNSYYYTIQKDLAIQQAQKDIDEASYKATAHAALAFIGLAVTAGSLIVLNHAMNMPLMSTTVNPILTTMAASAVISLIGGAVTGTFGTSAIRSSRKLFKAKKILKFANKQTAALEQAH